MIEWLAAAFCLSIIVAIGWFICRNVPGNGLGDDRQYHSEDTTMKLEIHVHHHVDGGVLGLLGEILSELKKGNGIMADVRQDIKDFAAKIDVATTAIATCLQTLVDNSKNLTADEKALLQSEVDTLTAMGKDPVNPIPPTPAL